MYHLYIVRVETGHLRPSYDMFCSRCALSFAQVAGVSWSSLLRRRGISLPYIKRSPTETGLYSRRPPVSWNRKGASKGEGFRCL